MKPFVQFLYLVLLSILYVEYFLIGKHLKLSFLSLVVYKQTALGKVRTVPLPKVNFICMTGLK